MSERNRISSGTRSAPNLGDDPTSLLEPTLRFGTMAILFIRRRLKM